MRKGQIKNVSYLKERRRQLRNNLTPAEAALWAILQNSKLKNIKFRRQHSIGNYIVDFFCPAYQLIIELDGAVHNNHDAAEYDFERDKQLHALGYRVIRFENKHVFQNRDWVIDEISNNLINK